MAVTGSIWLLLVGFIALSRSQTTVVPSSSTNSGDPAIVDGERAQPGEIPYQVAYFQHQPDGINGPCGGSLIRPTWVMTAAHCYTNDKGPAELRMGGTNVDQMSYREFANLRINHPEYDAVKLENDITLFRLPRAASGEGIAVIPLADDRYSDLVGTTFQASGFGYTFTGTTPDLMKTNLRGISNEQCQMTYLNPIGPNILCAQWFEQFGQSTCQGDSGGPLTTLDTFSNRVLVGVVSFGTYSCRKGDPVAFTRVSFFNTWINKQIEQNS